MEELGYKLRSAQDAQAHVVVFNHATPSLCPLLCVRLCDWRTVESARQADLQGHMVPESSNR